jgi:nucleoside-diphosphate kinase
MDDRKPDKFGYDAQPGAIRRDFDYSQKYHLIQGWDSPTSAQNEINLFFTPDEIIDYMLSDAQRLYSERMSPEK